MEVFEIISKYHKELWGGLKITLQICAIVFPVGIILGTLFGIARHKWKVIAGWPGTIFSLLISSTPFIVFLFWLHYPLQYLLHIVVNPFITSTFALSVIMLVIVSDIIKNSLNEFPYQYTLAGKACGLNKSQIVIMIQLPIIFRQALPNLLFGMVTVLQLSLFGSFIGVNEIFRVAQQINSDIYRPVQIYTALALFFIIICAALNILAFWLKSKLKWSFSEI